jgi:hypothetical protein
MPKSYGLADILRRRQQIPNVTPVEKKKTGRLFEIIFAAFPFLSEGL